MTLSKRRKVGLSGNDAFQPKMKSHDLQYGDKKPKDC